MLQEGTERPNVVAHANMEKAHLELEVPASHRVSIHSVAMFLLKLLLMPDYLKQKTMKRSHLLVFSP